MSVDFDECRGTLKLENDKFALDCNGKIAIRTIDDCAIQVLNQILTSLGGSVAATQKIFNVLVPTADTEVNLALPASITGYMIRTRGKSSLKLSHVVGESGTNFITIPSRATYTDNHNYLNLTIYFQSPTAGDTVEVVAWQ